MFKIKVGIAGNPDAVGQYLTYLQKNESFEVIGSFDSTDANNFESCFCIYTVTQFIQNSVQAMCKTYPNILMNGIGFYKKIQDELGVPVIDAIVAPLRYAELLSDIRQRQNWGVSNALGYETPDRAEMDAWVPIIEPKIYRDPRG